jgi:hypothetical protein
VFLFWAFGRFFFIASPCCEWRCTLFCWYTATWFGSSLTNRPLKEVYFCQVVIRQGELLVGILDKNQYGATPYSLSHLFFELYGGWVSADFLSGLSKLFTDFIKDEGEQICPDFHACHGI